MAFNIFYHKVFLGASLGVYIVRNMFHWILFDKTDLIADIIFVRKTNFYYHKGRYRDLFELFRAHTKKIQ